MSAGELKRELTKRELGIFLFALFALIAGFLKACVYTSARSIQELTTEIEKLRNDEQKLIVESPATPSEKNKAIAREASPDDVRRLTDLILNPAQLVGLKMTKSNFSNPIDPDGKYRQEADLSFSGELETLMSYINYIESLWPPFMIDQLTILAQDDNTELTLDIKGASYAKK
jgi:hypothetical protein